ncbi:MAG TPA: putative sulfate exporter family transporter [Dongiaceae bacterium]|nr:putative sulfate exporter family transporter [Dongiaceae bacterium]
MNPKIIFLLLLILSATGYISPPIALCAGIVFGLALTHPYPADSRALAKFLLQASVVALGFGMNLHEVLKAGRNGFLYTALGIGFALLLGTGIGKLLAVRGTTSYLISTGTAICGGSAIAAVGPIVRASDDEMAVSLGTVFILNAIALFVFPSIGAALGLSQTQFGLWAALAIHDTSSVVGAASRYGTEALVVATTVKLARALWIVPLALATAAVKHSKSKVQIPWFIFLFCAAALVNTYGPQEPRLSQMFFQLGRLGLTATLYLIGTGISRSTLKEVGWRPLAQGVLLWILVGAASLYCIRAGWIAL